MLGMIDTIERSKATSPPRRSSLAELPVLVLVALVLAVLLKTFLIQAFLIPSVSMQPTLEIGDRVMVNKVVHELRDPRRGEVVVFRDDTVPVLPDTRSAGRRAVDFLVSGLGTDANERDVIKRIIGLPGESVEVRDGTVLVDGEPLDEPTAADGGYLLTPTSGDFGPVTVPDDAYFMMGDNRDNSLDSRFALGFVQREDLIGRAFAVMWPPTRWDTLGIRDGARAAAAP